MTAGEKNFVADKLFITEHVMITAVGLQVGIGIIGGMLEASRKTGLEAVEEVEEYLLGRGGRQYAAFLEKHGAALNRDVCRLYFIFAARDRSGRLGMRMVGAEGGLPFSVLPLGGVITAPRRIGMEMSIAKLAGGSDETIREGIFSAMKRIAVCDSGVGPPYCLGMLGKEGNPRVLTSS